jgi:hypothetical protein
MFIHFGLYSMAGGMWKGRKIDNGYSEQILANAPLPPEEYAALARTFDPERFDPDAIVALAKAAGMKYIVITAKHHDGFNLFGTKVTNYNIVDATPYRRDLIKALADACKRGGIAFGVYYSTIDWHHPGGNRYIEGNSNPITPAQEAFNVAQLKELLSNYGPISEIWFDMGKPTPRQSLHFESTVHRLQPDTMVSGRVWNHQGDFTVMGDNAEPSVAVEEPWESPASMYPDTWGYRSWQVRDDLTGKVHEHIARLVHVVSAGGNYILNIGPEGDGSVVPFEADVLAGVGAWLKTNGQAIYGTRAQPFKALDFGYATLGSPDPLSVRRKAAGRRTPAASGRGRQPPGKRHGAGRPRRLPARFHGRRRGRGRHQPGGGTGRRLHAGDRRSVRGRAARASQGRGRGSPGGRAPGRLERRDVPASRRLRLRRPADHLQDALGRGPGPGPVCRRDRLQAGREAPLRRARRRRPRLSAPGRFQRSRLGPGPARPRRLALRHAPGDRSPSPIGRADRLPVVVRGVEVRPN